MKMKGFGFHARKLFLLGLTWTALAAQASDMPPPSIGVSPSRLEVEVVGGIGTGSATVLNLSNRDILVTTEVVNFDLDDSNDFRELPPDPGSLPTALMLNPVEFTVPANGSQTVRFAIMPERLRGQGEHRAMVFFSELVDTNHAAVKMKFRLGMPIYATLGDVSRKAILHDVAFEPRSNMLQMDLTSTGSAQVLPSGYYLWWPVEGFPSESKALARVREMARNPGRSSPKGTVGGRIVSKPVFPGTRRTVQARIAPPPIDGDYKLVYALEAGGQSVQRAIDPARSQILIVDSE